MPPDPWPVPAVCARDCTWNCRAMTFCDELKRNAPSATRTTTQTATIRPRCRTQRSITSQPAAAKVVRPSARRLEREPVVIRQARPATRPAQASSLVRERPKTRASSRNGQAMAMNVAKSLGLKKKPVAAWATLPRVETAESEVAR